MLSKGTKFFDTHKSFPFTFLTEPATTTIYWTLSIRKQSTYVARKKIGILEKTKDSGEVPEAGAKMLVTGGDYCVFICGHQVIEHQFVMPFVEVVKTIPGKCGQSLEKGSKNVVKLWPNLGDTRNKTL